ncbi:MAG: hypothetical protein RMJ36_00550 [Candidatus Calescibacterium sp.]|nr:hypothetical protein [Candidatus Calescibacterium sp.]MDW8132134.1 hypothetical protein [Candidatus Calescibacterium sp.]
MERTIVMFRIVIMAFILIFCFVFTKEKIKVYSYIPHLEIYSVIAEHIDKYKQSKVLSLFDINYHNVNNIMDLSNVLKDQNDNIDILIVPVQMRKIVEEYRRVRFWDEYFKNTPTFFAVFKTYTFDFMKDLSYVNGSVEFLPFFAYSFYYKELFPSVKNLNIIEFLAVYNGLINTIDYVNFYNNYLKNMKVKSHLYSLVGNVNDDGAKIFSIKDNFIQMDSPFVLYGIFLTSNPQNITKKRAIDFLATKIWDFETQIDLCLRVGVLGADKNTTLHPGFIQKLKDKKFSLHYNNQLGKIKKYRVDYDLFYNFYNIFTQEDFSNSIFYLQAYIKLLLYNTEFLYSNYHDLIVKNKFKNYLIGIFNNEEKNKIEKFIYTPEFVRKTFKIFEKKRVDKNREIREYSSKSVYDIAFLILKEDKRLKDLEKYNLKHQKDDTVTLIHESKEGKILFMKRKTPKYSIVIIAE